MQTPSSRPRSALRLIARVLLCTFVFAGVFAAIHQPAPPSALPDARVASASPQPEPNGEKLYLTRCMSCHQMNGQGVTGTFPPLDGADWVTGDKGRLVRVVLHGLSGEIMVNKTKYNGAMPGWGTFMSDAEVAALTTYVRGAWSNDASKVTADEVKAIRAAYPDRKQPWKAAELEQPENLGVPGQESEGAGR